MGTAAKVTAEMGMLHFIRAAGCRFIVGLLLFALLGVAPVLPASAQALPGLPSGSSSGSGGGSNVTVDDLQSLLSTLENPAEREKLATQIRTLIAAKKQTEAPKPGVGEKFLDVITAHVDEVGNDIATAAAGLVNAPELFTWLRRQVTDQHERTRIFYILLKLAVVFGAGIAAAWITRYALARPRRATENAKQASYFFRWVLLFARTLLEVTPVVVFAVVCYLVLPFTGPRATSTGITLAIVDAVILSRIVLAVAFLILAPTSRSLRLMPISDESANYTYIWVRRLTSLSIYGYFGARIALLLGLGQAGYATVLNVLGLVVAVMLVIFILQTRHDIGVWIRGERHGHRPSRFSAVQSMRRLVGDLWHVVAILYVCAIYFVWALHIAGGFQFVLTATVATVLILVAARVLVALSDRAIAHGFSINSEMKLRFPTLERRANRYLTILNIAAKVAIYGLAVVALLQVWGLHAVSWVTSDLGREIIATILIIALTIGIALACWEVACLYMESYLTRAERDGMPEDRRARMRTLFPIVRKGLLAILVAIVGLIVLSQLGVNIAPLLAGAGIVGLAVGFGAQKLVQDLFMGMFVFLEAAVAIGDIVELGGHSGIVEAMSIRSIRLRDLEGNVHTIPFSSVTTVMNQSKDYSYYMFDIGVAYRENTDRVVGVVHELAEELRADKSFSYAIIEPLEVLGVDRFADSAVMIKARIKTLPGRQWIIGREFNRRLKLRFDELGIEIPFPQRTITFTGDIPVLVERKGAADGGPKKAESKKESGPKPADPHTSDPHTSGPHRPEPMEGHHDDGDVGHGGGGDGGDG